MCTHMMSGLGYSAFPDMPLMLLSMLLSVALLAVVIWSMAHWLSGKAALGRRNEPQPHDEPYAYIEPREPALQELRERYAHGEIEP